MTFLAKFINDNLSGVFMSGSVDLLVVPCANPRAGDEQACFSDAEIQSLIDYSAQLNEDYMVNIMVIDPRNSSVERRHSCQGCCYQGRGIKVITSENDQFFYSDTGRDFGGKDIGKHSAYTSRDKHNVGLDPAFLDNIILKHLPDKYHQKSA